MISHNTRKTNLLIITIILFLAFSIRVFDLENNPPGFFSDEAAIGYNAYKILKTGKDEYGVPFPIFFKSFGDYRLPIPIYANIPIIALFGLNERSVRLTAVIFGLISILFTMLSTLEIADKRTAYLAGLLLAIMPWHIHFSRWGAESIYFPAIFSIGLYFYLKSFINLRLLSISSLFYGLSMYTYYPAIIIAPIFLLKGLITLYIIKRKFNKFLYYSLFTFLLFCLPLIYSYKAGNLQSRWKNIINNSLSRNEKIQNSIFSYLNHFSPDFLFIKGDSGFEGQFISRHSVREFGQLHIFYLPLLLIGLLNGISKLDNPKLFSVLILLLLYPLGSALTSAGPFATRSVIGLIPLTILSAIGFNQLLNFIFNLKQKYIHVSIGVLLFGIICFTNYFYFFAFFIKYPKYASDYWGWQYGPKSIMSYFIKEKNNYDDLYMTGNFNAPDIFLEFYDPENECQNCKIGHFEEVNTSRKQLFAARIEELPKFKAYNYKVKKILYYPSNIVAFYIFEITGNK